MPSYTRYDLEHVTDPSHRPTDREYDRFLWLLELLKRVRYDEAEIYERHPFLVKDVLFSAILVAANEALLEISEVVEAPQEDRTLIEGWIERGRAGLEEQWDPHLGLCLDQDVLADEPLRVRTVAGFAPLISGGLDRSRLRDLLDTLDSQAFCGNPRLRYPLPPSTSPEESGFHPAATGAVLSGPSPTGSSGGRCFARERVRKPRGFAERPLRSSQRAVSRSTSSRSPVSHSAPGSNPGPPPSPSTCSPQEAQTDPRQDNTELRGVDLSRSNACGSK